MLRRAYRLSLSLGIALSGCASKAPSEADSLFTPSQPEPRGQRAPAAAPPEPRSVWGALSSLPETPFHDVTAQLGVIGGHGFVDDYYTTGQAFADYDRDGDLDLYVTDSRGPNILYDNNGNGTFSISRFLGQVSLDTAVSGGAIFADYDNDDDPDLLVLNLGPNTLLRNDGAAGFVDVSVQAGLADAGKGQSAAFGDFDNDGDLDLYVVNWWCVECDADLWTQTTDRLYENRGDGTFRDVTRYVQDHTYGAGYAASWLDYDSDGDLDLYVANDKGFEGAPQAGLPHNQNVLFRNDGAGCDGWCFEEVAAQSGADLRMEGMGLAIADFDGDLDLDVFVTNTGQPKLLRNQGNAGFDEVAVDVGVIDDQTTWGTVFTDVDNDGDMDLYASVGVAFGIENKNRLFENLGDGTFLPSEEHTGAEYVRHTIGVAAADIDNDGGVDLVVGGWAHGYRVFANLSARRSGNGWTRVRLRGGGRVNRDAIGTRVYLALSDGRTLMQEVKSGASHGAGHDLAVHFGLGDATIVHLEVLWPDGTREVLTEVPVGIEWAHEHPAR